MKQAKKTIAFTIIIFSVLILAPYFKLDKGSELNLFSYNPSVNFVLAATCTEIYGSGWPYEAYLSPYDPEASCSLGAGTYCCSSESSEACDSGQSISQGCGPNCKDCVHRYAHCRKKDTGESCTNGYLQCTNYYCGSSCCSNGSCVSCCTPNCGSNTCGNYDGCGGSCGTCTGGLVCSSSSPHTCVSPNLLTDRTCTSRSGSVKASYITELRSWINTARTQASMSNYSWTDSTLTNVSIKTTHMSQMCTAITELKTNRGYTGAGACPGSYTSIKSSDINTLCQFLANITNAY